MRGYPFFLAREGMYLPGEVRAIPVPEPAAGAEWTVNVPGGRQWRVLGGTFKLTTSATVDTRTPAVVYSLGGARFFAAEFSTGQAAGVTDTYVMQQLEQGESAQVAGGLNLIDVPKLWWPGGTIIESSTDLVQAGDQYSDISLYVEEVWFANSDLRDHDEHRHHPANPQNKAG